MGDRSSMLLVPESGMSSSCAWTPSPTSSTHTDTELSVCALAQGQEACPKQRTLTANRPGVEDSPPVLLEAAWGQVGEGSQSSCWWVSGR